jgi:hypothetical protein
MRRITKDWLNSRVKTINIMLGRPVTHFAPDNGPMNVGHLMLDKDSTGYKLVEIGSATGGERDYTRRLPAKEMDIALDGIVNGMALSNRYMEQKIVKEMLEKAGVADIAPMYSDTILEQIRPYVKGKV